MAYNSVKLFKHAFLAMTVFAGFLPVFFIHSAQAANIAADIKIKDSFQPGEKITFTYEINSAVAQTIAFTPQIACNPEIPQPIPNLIEAELSGKKYVGEYSGVEVSDSFQPASCRAILSVTRPSTEEFSRDFVIKGNSPIDMRFLICEDSGCGKELKDFSLDTPFYLNYSAQQKFPVQAMILDANGNALAILELPDWYSFKEPGDYTIEFSFNQPGFQPKNYAKPVSIGGIKDTTACNNDGKCDLGETQLACPRDCSGKSGSREYIWILPIVIGFCILLGVVAFSLMRSGKNKTMAG